MIDWSARDYATVLSILCFTGLLWRAIGYWFQMTVLEDILVLILLSLMIVSAFGTYRLDKIHAPASGVIYYSIVVKVAILLAIFCWPYLVDVLNHRKRDRFR